MLVCLCACVCVCFFLGGGFARRCLYVHVVVMVLKEDMEVVGGAGSVFFVCACGLGAQEDMEVLGDAGSVLRCLCVHVVVPPPLVLAVRRVVV